MLRAVRVLWLTPLALAACAHQQVAEAPAAPPVVAEAAPPVAEAPDQNKADDTAELKRILSGPIAHFEYDQAQLTGESRQKLQTLATALKAHPAARIRIAGNCDELGPPSTTWRSVSGGQKWRASIWWTSGSRTREWTPSATARSTRWRPATTPSRTPRTDATTSSCSARAEQAGRCSGWRVAR